MTKNKIILSEDKIPIDAVEANNNLQAINEMKNQMQHQFDETVRQMDILSGCFNKIYEEVPPLLLALNSTIAAVKDGVQIQLPKDACRQIESAGNDICTRMIKQLDAKSHDIINIITRHHKCIPISQDIFWCMISIITIQVFFFALICAINYRLQITELWRIICGIALSIVGTISLTIYLHCR